MTALTASWVGRGALLLVPLGMLAIWFQDYNPFLTGKTELFEALTALGGMAAGLVWARHPRWPTAAVWAWAAMTTALLVADLLAAFSTKVALLGSPDRQSGLVLTVTELGYLAALPVLFDTARSRGWLIRAWACAGLLAALSGLWQWTEHSSDVLHGYRLYGAFGQPVFFGEFLVMSVLFTVWAARLSRSPAFWWGVAGLELLILSLTHDREALGALALIGAGGLLLGLPRSRRGLGLVGVTCALGLAAWIGAPGHIPVLQDLVHRAGCFRDEFHFVALRPLLGWGQENLHVICGMELWDRTHDAGLQVLADGGIVALMPWLAFIAAAFWSARRSRPVLALLAAFLLLTALEPDAIMASVPMLTGLGLIERTV